MLFIVPAQLNNYNFYFSLIRGDLDLWAPKFNLYMFYSTCSASTI